MYSSESDTAVWAWRCSRHVGIALALTGTACTATLDFAQCRDHDECADGRDEPRVCVASECVVPDSPRAVACVQRDDCTAVFGAHHLCLSQGVCASLLSPECKKISEPPNPRHAVFVGSILSTTGPHGHDFPVQQGVQLAVEDFNALASLPDGKTVGWIGCDAQGSTQTAQRAAQHLIKIGVPAIVGPGSRAALSTLTELTVPQGVLALSPTAATVSPETFDDRGLVWRTMPSDVYQASAIADRLAAMGPTPQRILIFARDDRRGRGLLEPAIRQIDRALPRANVASLLYPDLRALPSALPLENYGGIVARGLRHRPDVVVVLGAAEAEAVILLCIQTLLQERAPADLPSFIVSNDGIEALARVEAQVDASTRAQLLGRLEAVSWFSPDANTVADYAIRYRARFTDDDPFMASGLGYDAAMVVLFAMAGARRMDGTAIAAEIPQLVPPEPYTVALGGGVSSIKKAIEKRFDGAGVDVEGIRGSLDFDVETGEARGDFMGWVLVEDPGGSNRGVLKPVRRYRSASSPAVGGTWSDR